MKILPGKRSYKSATLTLGYSSALPKHMRKGVIELTSLGVPIEDRRKGYATALLERVCSEANGAGVVLMIHVQPFGDEGITDVAKLIGFYERFGFRKIQDSPVILMARSPQAARRPNLALAAALIQVMH
jgi:N-acetylglutamate synthase-like GNAT family acetyltransferase